MSDYRKLQFDRAANRYDQLSSVQRAMAERLMELVPRGAEPSSILELGSGTGHLTRFLLAGWPASRVVVTDVSDVMLALCRQGLESSHAACEWTRLDGSGLNEDWAALLQGGAFELVASNALLQWLGDPDAHLGAVAAALREGGHYLVSSFAAEHFPELRAILEEPPFDYPRLPGVDPRDFSRRAEHVGLRLTKTASDEIRLTYPSPRALLRSLSEMGASRYPSGRRLTPSRLELLERTFEARHSVRGGVVCTYRPWYALFERLGQRDT